MASAALQQLKPKACCSNVGYQPDCGHQTSTPDNPRDGPIRRKAKGTRHLCLYPCLYPCEYPCEWPEPSMQRLAAAATTRFRRSLSVDRGKTGRIIGFRIRPRARLHAIAHAIIGVASSASEDVGHRPPLDSR